MILLFANDPDVEFVAIERIVCNVCRNELLLKMSILKTQTAINSKCHEINSVQRDKNHVNTLILGELYEYNFGVIIQTLVVSVRRSIDVQLSKYTQIVLFENWHLIKITQWRTPLKHWHINRIFFPVHGYVNIVHNTIGLFPIGCSFFLPYVCMYVFYWTFGYVVVSDRIPTTITVNRNPLLNKKSQTYTQSHSTIFTVK